jgi:hypothetical protein
MTRPNDIIRMLVGNVEFVCRGSNYDDIDWLGNTPPITKEQYEKGFEQYNAWKAEQEAIQAEAKTALLDRLGITEDEAKLLLS